MHLNTRKYTNPHNHNLKNIFINSVRSLAILCALLMPVCVYSSTPALSPSNDTVVFKNNLNSAHDLHTLSPMPIVNAGGYGGNARTGQFIYSGTATTLPALKVSKHGNLCYTFNNDAIIDNINTQLIVTFPCTQPDPKNNNVYWDGSLGKVNGGYSPENDALYASNVVTKMFHEWYGLAPYIDEHGQPQPVTIHLHSSKLDNSWLQEDNSIVIGDGYKTSYPLTSLDTISYMFGYIFTAQHSKLSIEDQVSFGISVAFSSMTSMATEYYTTGKNTWMIGAKDSKDGKPLHYLDQPSKNCEGKEPGNFCDIDNYSQYFDYMSGYFSSGIYNRAFYLLATTEGWDTRKAYDVFLQANRFHWQANTSFVKGACDVITSANELKYDTKAIKNAFLAVGIDTTTC